MTVTGIPFFPPSRAVIMMMDDGVCVHRVSGDKSTYLDFVLWRQAGFEDRLVSVLTDANVASVLILNDAVEQHYRKERVTIPTSFDKANIIKRRLNVAFPSYPMRAAIALKDGEKTKDQKDGQDTDKSKPFLFAASPSTETFSRVVRSIAKTECNLFGYGLLPLEATGLLKKLSTKLSSKEKNLESAKWTILIGQHRGGGLRQIVVRKDELALTRVTPVDEPKQGQADVWAIDVSKEIQATLSYLARFGYAPEDGLNIIVLGDPEFAQTLDGTIDVASNFVTISPFEAGKALGIKLSHDEAGHFADGLHAAWVGSKIVLDVPLNSKEISDIAGPRKVASVLMLVLVLGLGAVGYLISREAQGIYQDKANLEVSKQQLAEIEQIYRDEIKRKSDLGIDINTIKSSLDIDARIKRQHIDVLALLDAVSQDLGNLRIDKFEFKNEGDVLWSSPSQTDIPPVRKANLKLNFSFAGNINPKDGNKEMSDFVDKVNLRIIPMGYRAKVEEPLQNLTYSGEIAKEVGLTANLRSLNDRYTSVILIEKVAHVKSPGQ
jgi:hypothetical protein